MRLFSSRHTYFLGIAQQVRLEDTILSTMNGRLEICINNAWGAVCNGDLFGVSDVQVVCQQVGGYEREILGDIDSVSIMGPVFLSELRCDEN